MIGLATPVRHEEVAKNTVVLVFVAAVLCVVTLFRQSPASRFWVPAALAGIAIAIWHGAYDSVLGRQMWQPRYAGRWLLPFAASYVALAALVVVAWYVYAPAALVAFLLYSGVHFGMETETGRSPLQMASAIAFGCLPIAAASFWQTGSVVPIFATMLRGQGVAAERITAVAGTLLIPCIVLSLVPIFQNGLQGIRRAALIAAELLLFRFCPPVVAFAVFFCLLHTPEHLMETSRTAAGVFSVERMWQNLRAGMIPWLISLAAIAVAAWMGQRTVQAYTAMLFIALSALTVPHMALAMFSTVDTSRNEKLSFRSVRRTAHP